MWARKRIDAGWTDLLYAGVMSVWPGRWDGAATQVERAWRADALACFSVRSGLDLLLGALEWPEGSEVLVSAVTIPDMITIIEHHGLVAVPVDLDPADMSPTLESLREQITPRTRGLLVAHLFGTVLDLSPMAQVAQEHGLLLIEDCAQAYDGERYQGHSEADVVAFSFGPIKTATALGGGLLTVSDQALRRRMRQLQSAMPIQSRWAFFRRVCHYAVLKLLALRPVFTTFVWLCRRRGRDVDQVLSSSVRNFAAGDLISRLRFRPCVPMLKLIRRRLLGFDLRRQDRRTNLGRRLAATLGTEACPGAAAERHTFWVFPLRSGDPAATTSRLQGAGFDATTANQLRVVSPPSSGGHAAAASRTMSDLVFLPVYPEMPERAVDELAAAVLSAEQMETTDD